MKFFGILALLFGLSACQFQPLHGTQATNQLTARGLSGIGVSSVNSRVAQQVRNHLLFLFNGGDELVEKTHEVRLRVSWNNRQVALIQQVEDSTSAVVTVITSYEIVNLADGKTVASGKRVAEAPYDRTGQVFANERAERDAENRAAKEVAESIRLAVAADLNKS